jgi:hypothetical protein
LIDRETLIAWLWTFPGVIDVSTVGDGTPEVRVETESAEVATTIETGAIGIMALEASVSGSTVFISSD